MNVTLVFGSKQFGKQLLASYIPWRFLVAVWASIDVDLIADLPTTRWAMTPSGFSWTFD
jgi:hypothetical protein